MYSCGLKSYILCRFYLITSAAAHNAQFHWNGSGIYQPGHMTLSWQHGQHCDIWRPWVLQLCDVSSQRCTSLVDPRAPQISRPGSLTRVTLYSRALAHSRALLFTQPCPHCSHSRASGEQWARLCVFTLQSCVQTARLCRGSPVIKLWMFLTLQMPVPDTFSGPYLDHHFDGLVQKKMWLHVPTSSTLIQAMSCCRQTQSHYLNQCQFIANRILWHSHEGNFTGI